VAVRVVTDSTADLPKDLADSLGVTIVPLKVLFGDETLRDGVDIVADAFYPRLTTSKVNPTTSQPSAGEFEAVYRQLGAGGDEICSIHISSKLSGTFNSASAAASAVSDSIQVAVVDSELVSMALGVVVIRVAKAAAAGASLDECVRLANEAAGQTKIMFLVDTLEYLKRGGRIGSASAFLGALLNIKPMLMVKDGEVAPAERIRTRTKGLDRLFEWACGFSGVNAICVLASPPLEDANDLAFRLVEAMPGVTLYRGVLGPVVGTHAGPGLVGVAVYTGPKFD
jgi:DegV family protein with EDD domain